jgi:hypothetical protein
MLSVVINAYNPTSPDKGSETWSQKQNTNKRAGGMAQVVGSLHHTGEARGSIPRRKGRRGKGREATAHFKDQADLCKALRKVQFGA